MYYSYSYPQNINSTFSKGAVTLGNSKETKKTYTTSSTGHIDEGRNETIRIPYTDSISVPAAESTLKKSRKEGRK